MKKPTCFESSNPTYIDLIVTNKKELFKNTDVRRPWQQLEK